MYSKIISGTALGVDGMLISVEADISPGLPGISLVGYLSSSVREAGDRVRTAIKNSGYSLPARRITVNLSPADLRKDGVGYDLAIAAALLVSMQIIPFEKTENVLIMGELGLDGSVRGIPGILPVVHYAQKQGIEHVIVPFVNRKEAEFIDGINVVGVRSLAEMIEYFGGETEKSEKVHPRDPPEGKCSENSEGGENKGEEYDLGNLYGQEIMKQGVIYAVAGFHNLLLEGAAGSGKSMLAKCIPGIMPELTYEEQLETTKIYSVAGLLKSDGKLIQRRPFRSPHHTITEKALMGGGAVPRPGEVSLASNGVLFLDEFPEFSRSVIEALRQPMEDRDVTISRVRATYHFPANFILVTAANLCPCGKYPDRNLCRCTERQILDYRNKISYPIMDRIDIQIGVEPVGYEEICLGAESGRASGAKNVIDSRFAREVVLRARKAQEKRFRNEKIVFNSEIPQSRISDFITVTEEGETFLREAFRKGNMSARGYYKTLRLARTIADCNGHERIETEDVIQSIFFRNTRTSDGGMG